MQRNLLLFISFIFFISSCSVSKKAEKNVSSGNYDTAFDLAFADLRKDKSDDKKIVLTFKEAFDRATERDQRQIDLYRSQNNPQSLKQIYALYEKIDARQYQVITLQPLYYQGKEVNFDIVDYTNDIATAKNNYSQFLFQKAEEKMASPSKLDAREAYQLLSDLEYINPTYRPHLSNMKEDAKLKGSTLVLLNVNNQLGDNVSTEDLAELTRISESNMSNPWILYHAAKDNNMFYDYDLDITLQQMEITPQQVNSELIQQQARVKDGWEYVYDTNGNVAKDSLGNDIKRDKIITVQAELRIMQQVKAGMVQGQVQVKNVKTNSIINTAPILGEAKFENVFGVFRGDQRAIEEKYYDVLQNKEVPFPVDTVFVKYSLGDFKTKMLQFIDSQNL